MPAPTDREAVRLEIIKACQRCAMEKPLPAVSLRDVAKEMGVTHASLLYYFRNKDELLMACSRWAGSEFSRLIDEWFRSHTRSDFPSDDEFLDAFLSYMIADGENQTKPRAVVMNCAMGEYSPEIKEATRLASEEMKATLHRGLELAYGRKLDEDITEAIFVMMYGMYFCAFNQSLRRESEKHILSAIRRFLTME